MTGVSKLSTPEVSKKASKLLKSLGKNSAISVKLQAVISSQKHNITKVADVFGVTRQTLTSWIKSVASGDIDALFIAPGRGRKSKLSQPQMKELSKWIECQKRVTCKELKFFVERKFNIAISIATAHRIFTTLGFSYITPRPKHYKADSLAQDNFKKK